MSEGTDDKTYLDPRCIVAHQIGGLWLVGVASESKDDGERAMRALVDVYNSMNRLRIAGHFK